MPARLESSHRLRRPADRGKRVASMRVSASRSVRHWCYVPVSLVGPGIRRAPQIVAKAEHWPRARFLESNLADPTPAPPLEGGCDAGSVSALRGPRCSPADRGGLRSDCYRAGRGAARRDVRDDDPGAREAARLARGARLYARSHGING